MSLSRVVCDRHLIWLLSLLQTYIIALGTAQFLLVEGRLAQRHSGSAPAIVFDARQSPPDAGYAITGVDGNLDVGAFRN
jgi:hypothetical protein